MVADYVPYVNAVDSRWSSYGSDSASSARYAERYGLSLYVFCSLLMFKILNTVKTNKKLLIDFKIKIMGFSVQRKVLENLSQTEWEAGTANLSCPSL